MVDSWLEPSCATLVVIVVRSSTDVHVVANTTDPVLKFSGKISYYVIGLSDLGKTVCFLNC